MTKKRSPASRPARRAPPPPAKRPPRRSGSSLAVVKKRLLDGFTPSENMSLRRFCVKKNIPYKTAWDYLNRSNHSERDGRRAEIRSAIVKMQRFRRKRGQKCRITASEIKAQLGGDKFPLGVRQIARLVTQLFPKQPPRRMPQSGYQGRWPAQFEP